MTYLGKVSNVLISWIDKILVNVIITTHDASKNSSGTRKKDSMKTSLNLQAYWTTENTGNKSI